MDLASEITKKKKPIVVASFVLSHIPTLNSDFVFAEVYWPWWNSQSCLVREVQMCTGLTPYLYFLFFLFQLSLVARILPHLRNQAMAAVFLTARRKVSWAFLHFLSIVPVTIVGDGFNVALTLLVTLSHLYQFGDFSFLEGNVKTSNLSSLCVKWNNGSTYSKEL